MLRLSTPSDPALKVLQVVLRHHNTATTTRQVILPTKATSQQMHDTMQGIALIYLDVEKSEER